MSGIVSEASSRVALHSRDGHSQAEQGVTGGNQGRTTEMQDSVSIASIALRVSTAGRSSTWKGNAACS